MFVANAFVVGIDFGLQNLTWEMRVAERRQRGTVIVWWSSPHQDCRVSVAVAVAVALGNYDLHYYNYSLIVH